MFDWFDSVPANYFCCLMLPRILWPMAIADAVIAISYFAIGGWLFMISMKPSVYPTAIRGGRLLLGLFILLCGTGHAIDVIKIWRPMCDTMVIENIATATVSLMTWLWAWANKETIIKAFALGKPK
jgi:hypothetical protein